MPTYTYACGYCGNAHEEVRKIADRDNETLCVCGTKMTKLIEAPLVMQVALPDGTKRFDNVRRHVELEKAKKTADKLDKAKIVAEQGKIIKGAS